MPVTRPRHRPPLPPEERRVLALVREVERRALDLDHGVAARATLGVLRRHAAHLAPDLPQALGPALAALERRGALTREGRGWRVTTTWRPRADRARRALARQVFTGRLRVVATSATYATLARRLLGHPLALHGPTDAAQLHALEQQLPRRPALRLLEVGCGTGALARHLAQAHRARVLATDLVPPGQRGLPRPVAPTRGQLRFAALDLDGRSLPRGPFDAIIAVDVLPYTRDPAGTVARLAARLAPGGRLLVLASVVAPHPLRRARDAHLASPLAIALVQAGLDLTVHDLTAAERRHWRRLTTMLRAAKGAFAAEGNAGFARDWAAEATRAARWAREGRVYRALLVGRAGRASARSPGSPST
jgi:SAM-dependent methyltransferase